MTRTHTFWPSDGKYPPGQEGACPAGGPIKIEFTHAP